MGKDEQQTKELTLAKAVADINKRFGEGSIQKLGEAEDMQVERMSTGSLTLDMALGGGLPKGRIIEIFGPESSGKTTLCQHIVAECQKAGGNCAYIDMEHALDPLYAEKTGVDISKMYISQPDTGEQALEIAEALVRTGAMDVIIIDSVAALVPRAELEGDMGDAVMGAQARLMSQAMRKLAGAVGTTGCTLVFTNQLRQKIGVMFGNPETTPGGNALKYYASVRMDVRRIQSLKKGEEVTGNRTRVRVVKNKVSPPFRTAEFDIVFNEGISKIGEIIDMGTNLEVITKRGAFYSYGEQKLGQGKENTREFMKLNPELTAQIEADIRAKGAGTLVFSVDEGDSGDE